jgi:hypothetical protein
LLHQFGDLFELNVKFRCQNVKHLEDDGSKQVLHKGNTAKAHAVAPSSSNGIHYPNASFIIFSVISVYLLSLYSMIAPLLITNYKNVRHVE